MYRTSLLCSLNSSVVGGVRVLADYPTDTKDQAFLCTCRGRLDLI
ncbi:hypothetical protein HMPREF1556_00128 [Porphyromonas sp. oral taxon 278 str. W7784]|nr:hypothetical protein HMPREF1556_00128 [Porphyromonas sp. oral taxon 278 str. W7784]